jgi:hypothetical protein
MRVLSFFLFLLTTLSVQASGLEAKLRAALPAPLDKAQLGKTTIGDLEAKMGKPDLIEGSKRYWIKNGLKYAVVLSFKKDKLSSIHYTFTEGKPSLESIYSDLKQSALEPYNTRYLIHRSPSAEVVIDPTSKKIYSVRIK